MEKQLPTNPSPNNGKRGPTCSLSGSSSSEGEGSDHEDIPPSPCSSTSSGPTYVRPPGFKHHGQEIRVENKPKVNIRIKRKIKRQSMMKDVLPISQVKSHVTTPPQVTKVTKEEKMNVQVLPPSGMKTKVRKDPIPMRLRALPQSFWQQPNTVNPASPGSMYSVLPPLCKTEQSTFDMADIRPVTPPSDGETFDLREIPTLPDQPEIKKEPSERKDALIDKESLKIDLRDIDRDASRDRDSTPREISPRDREISPRDKEISTKDKEISPRGKEISPRDREISPREREISPRDKDLTPRDRDLTPRERDLTPRDKDFSRGRELAIDRDSIRDKEIVREKETTTKRDLRECAQESREMRSVSLPPEARKKQPRPPPRIVKVSPANTELLAKLFEGIDGEGKKKMVRRGRPKREYTPHQAIALATAQSAANASNNNNNSSSNNNNNASGNSSGSNTNNTATTTSHHHPYLIGEDPYMIDSVAEGLLPLLSLETSRQTSGPSSQLSIVAIRGDNNRMLSLPSLSVEQNHSAILSELVKAL